MKLRYMMGIAATERLADRFPDQFAELDCDEALDLYFTARALTPNGDAIDEEVLSEARCRNLAEASHDAATAWPR